VVGTFCETAARNKSFSAGYAGPAPAAGLFHVGIGHFAMESMKPLIAPRPRAQPIRCRFFGVSMRFEGPQTRPCAGPRSNGEQRIPSKTYLVPRAPVDHIRGRESTACGPQRSGPFPPRVLNGRGPPDTALRSNLRFACEMAAARAESFCGIGYVKADDLLGPGVRLPGMLSDPPTPRPSACYF